MGFASLHYESASSEVKKKKNAPQVSYAGFALPHSPVSVISVREGSNASLSCGAVFAPLRLSHAPIGPAFLHDVQSSWKTDEILTGPRLGRCSRGGRRAAVQLEASGSRRRARVTQVQGAPGGADPVRFEKPGLLGWEKRLLSNNSQKVESPAQSAQVHSVGNILVIILAELCVRTCVCVYDRGYSHLQ